MTTDRKQTAAKTEGAIPAADTAFAALSGVRSFPLRRDRDAVCRDRSADGAEFHLVPGIDQQRVVCVAAGNPADGRLWWFVDGQPLGETVGDAPFVWVPESGAHVVTCATADGVTASASFTVSQLE